MSLAVLRRSPRLACAAACWMLVLACRPGLALADEDEPEAAPAPAARAAEADGAAPAASTPADRAEDTSQRVSVRTRSTRGGTVAASRAALAVVTAGGSDEHSAASSHVISAPEGAGKVQGTGESFATELSTGAVTGRIPFAVPTARGLAQPNLALTYSSHDGEHEAGMGWRLAVPSVARQTDRGLPAYGDPPPGGAWIPGQDRFVADGRELVPICLVSPGGGCAGAQPGEVMPGWAAGWQYFRPSVENEFERYFWSPDHRTWRVQRKDGVNLELGVPLDGTGDANAIERDPDDASRIFRWNLARAYDAHGDADGAQVTPKNVVVYRYQSVDGINYLSDVFDTPPRAGGGLDRFAHHVRLVYQARPDATWSYRRGWGVRASRRLVHVDVTSKTFVGAGAARELVRRYWLAYDPTRHLSLLASVQMEGRCASGNPVEDADQRLPDATSCPRLPATAFEYTHADAADASGKPRAADLPGYEPFDTRVHVVQGSPAVSVDDVHAGLYDLNGDALPDVLQTDGTHGAAHGAYLQGGAGAADALTATTVALLGVGDDSVQNITLGSDNVSPLDIDGDGIVDLVHMPAAASYGVYSPVWTGAGWALRGREVATASGQSVHIDFRQSRPEVKRLDVDGDGLIDVVYSTGQSYQTFFALGRFPGGADQYGHAAWTGPGSAAIDNGPVPMCVPATAVPVQLSDADVRIADLNGDGLPDLVRVDPGQIVYWPGRGNGLWGTGRIDDCGGGRIGYGRDVATSGAPSFSQSLTAIRFDDMNGDGLDDLVQVRDGAVDIWLNVDGTGWTSGRHVVIAPRGAQTDHVRIADFDGSGTRDVVWADGRNYRYVDLTGGARPWLLARVRNGLGKTNDYEYHSSTALMLQAAAAGAPWSSTTPVPVPVVTRVVESNNLAIAGGAASTRVTDYEYRDPVYDGREREFRGFATARTIERGDDNSPTAITETHFLLGQCEEEQGQPARCDAADRWRDNPREALKGLVLWSETRDEDGTYLSTTHHGYRLRRLYVGSDGREVRHAFERSRDEYRYDDGPFTAGSERVTLTDVELDLGGGIQAADSGDYPLRGTGWAHLRKTMVIDPFGNQTDEIDAGCVEGCGAADEAITRHTTPALPSGDASGWLWRPVEQYVVGSATAGRWHRELTQYDPAGQPIRVTDDLAGTLPLDRFHQEPGKAVAPTPSTASSDGLIVRAALGYDEFGNRTAQSGAHGHCRTVAYDQDYAELPVVETELVGQAGADGCGTTALSTVAAYDRGLSVVTMTIDLHGELTTASYDGFGRLTELHKPSPLASGVVSAAAAQEVEYILPGDATATPYTIVHTRTQDGADADSDSYADAWAFIDGFGHTVATLQQADPSAGDGGSFVAAGLTDYDAKGAVRRVFQPWFWTGDPQAFPLTTQPTAPFRLTRYDAFGRVLDSYGLDGARDGHKVYHALSEDVFDEADLEPGPHQDTPSTERKDGHGRTVALVERVHVGGRIEAREVQTQYLPGGEKAVIRRVRVGSADPPVVRWIRYDSLGRMVLNVEPNTSRGSDLSPNADPSSIKAWRYAWDDDGELVGTSDARGCGENYWYDAGGRLVAEDYSPCSAGQPAYSPPDLSSGDGTEVFNRYDSLDADALAISGFAVDPALCAGRLVETWDLGSKTVRRFDGRGRVSGVARRLARPGAASPMLAARYTPHWYAQTVSFDGADRVVAQTSGADVPELLGADGQSGVSIAYTARSAVRSVGSSYGAIVTSAAHDADGHLTRVVYGDLAATTTERTYDTRRRLSTVNTHRGPPDAWSASPPAYAPAPNGAATLQAVLQNVRFGYDNVDNPVSIEDLRDPSEWPEGAKPVSRTAQYDDLYRLTETDLQYPGNQDAWTSPFASEEAGYTDPRRAMPGPRQSFDARPKQQTFGYDWLGNTIAGDDDSHGFYDRSLGTITNGPAAPYQLTAASNEATAGAHAGHLAARYDEAGNLVELVVARSGACRPVGRVCSQRFAYDWDEVGRLARARRWDLATPGAIGTPLPSSTPAAELRYAYGGDDERVLKTAVEAGGQPFHTAYVFGSLELRRTTFDGNDYQRTALTEVPYLIVRNVRLGRVVYGPADLPSMSGGQQHLFLELPDYLGSAAIVLDRETGELVESVTYDAFGATESDYRPMRWDAFREDHRFTDKEDDVELGISYFGKRYYAPLLGRWLSADPLAIHRLEADLNVYAYVHGRVLRAVDPNGLEGGEAQSSGTNGGASQAAALPAGVKDLGSWESLRPEIVAFGFDKNAKAPEGYDYWFSVLTRADGPYNGSRIDIIAPRGGAPNGIPREDLQGIQAYLAKKFPDFHINPDTKQAIDGAMILWAALTPFVGGLRVLGGALEQELLSGGEGAIEEVLAQPGAEGQARFMVTESGVSIPTNPAELKSNLSQLTESSTNPATSRKFVGSDSQGPLRVRVERAHPPDPNFRGTPDPLHTVDHLHIDRRANGLTGSWGSAEKVPYGWPF